MDKDKKKIIAGAGIVAAGLIGYFATRKTKGPPPVLDVTLSNLLITPTTVSPGEPVTISVLATNHSATPLAATIKLTGDFTDSQSVSLEAGTSQTVTFTVTPTAEKTYHVTVNGLSGNFVCTSAPHGDIVLSNLVISPPSCTVGDEVTISVTATNQGNANETMAVTLIIVGDKYSDSRQYIQQVVLEAGKSKTVTFTFHPLVAETYTATVENLSGTFVANPGATWPGWTPGVIVDYNPSAGVYGVTVEPDVIYLGESVTINVPILAPYPSTMPMTIEATISVDSVEISKTFTIDFYNPSLLFTYTPTAIGNYTVKAQDKTATFTVLANPAGAYYSPFGGKRLPLITDIVIPNVPAFTVPIYFAGTTFNWPSGDLKYSDMIKAAGGSQGGWYTPDPVSRFTIWPPFNIPQVLNLLQDAQPISWDPPDASISQFVLAVTSIVQMVSTSSVLMMAAEYSCKEYWDSKDELAKMIVGYCRGTANSDIYLPDAWILQYGTTCPTCEGTGQVYSIGRHRYVTCSTCHGLGKVLNVDLCRGIRDWHTYPGITTKCQNSPPGCNYYITCPFCGKLDSGYIASDIRFDLLSFARRFLEHMGTNHPNHPLTEPAWF
jgi:hypothetical protein